MGKKERRDRSRVRTWSYRLGRRAPAVKSTGSRRVAGGCAAVQIEGDKRRSSRCTGLREGVGCKGDGPKGEGGEREKERWARIAPLGTLRIFWNFPNL